MSMMLKQPDPTNPPTANEEPRRFWKTAIATPSVPPPAPTVTARAIQRISLLNSFGKVMNFLTIFLFSASMLQLIPRMANRSDSN